MSARVLRFHFDYLSPYAYLAWHAVKPLAARHGAVVEPAPVLLAALLAHGQTKGPAEIPAKRVWVWKDTFRTAHAMGVPLAPPPAHPFNPLAALRATIATPMADRARAIDALFAATWGGGSGVDGEARVTEVLTLAGLDGAALVAAGRAAKDELRAATDAAIAAGIFGVPTVQIGDECFWGLDSFGHVERHLRGEDPLRVTDVAQWAGLPASASRR